MVAEFNIVYKKARAAAEEAVAKENLRKTMDAAKPLPDLASLPKALEWGKFISHYKGCTPHMSRDRAARPKVRVVRTRRWW